jgi:hypothetical protein
VRSRSCPDLHVRFRSRFTGYFSHPGGLSTGNGMREVTMSAWVWVLIIVLLVLLLTGGIYVRR